MSRLNKLLINDVTDCVDEMLDDVIRINPGLVRLPRHRVILRDDVTPARDKVSVISGGGSGHEPFASGFVGQGMLTAAVCGSVFAAPPSDDIIAAIEAVTSSTAGCVLVVANYTGDRLNFGIAAETARNRGLKVETVIVGDDCAGSGRRGLIGVVMAMKIAGAMAEEGQSVNEICRVVNNLSMATIGLSLGGCSIPGSDVTSFNLPLDEMELGLGVHGEAGVKRVKAASADVTADLMIDYMTSHSRVQEWRDVSVTVNNLGGLSLIELHLVARRFMQRLRHRFNIIVRRCYFGHLMTSLDMSGLNINVTQVDDVIIKWLDADTNAASWPRTCRSHDNSNDLNERFYADDVIDHVLPPLVASKRSMTSYDDVMRCLKEVCEKLKKEEDNLNHLDLVSGDGDCGSTLNRGAISLLQMCTNTSPIPLSRIFINIARCVGSSMGGSSGALYNLFFTAAASKVDDDVTVSTVMMSQCLSAGIEAISKYGGAKPGDRTMLDALAPASDVMKTIVDEPVAEICRQMADAAAKGAHDTIEMVAKAGRASYVPSHLVNKPDPGAVAVSIIFAAIRDFFVSNQ